MVRIRALSLSSTVFAAACASACGGGVSSPPPPGNGSGSNPGDGGPPAELSAVSLGVTIMSRDPQGAPRLLRSFRPRASLTGLGAEAAARDHVTALTPLWVPHAKAMALATTGVQRLRNGATVVKLAQQVDGVAVDDGEVHVLLHVDGSLAAVSGTMLPAIASPRFAASPGAMLDRALDHQYGAARARPAIVDAGDAAGWRKLEVAPDPQLHVTDVRARRVIARDGGAMVPAWEIETFGDAPPDPLADPSIPVPSARRTLVADATGKVLSDTSLTQNDAFVYRVYAETTGNRRPLDGPLTDFSPHPTGFPDGSAPTGTVKSNLVVMDAFNAPADPWLPANATVASGNNADAFSDLDGSGTFTAGDIRPGVQSGRVLNYHYDTTLEPLATADQIKAGVISTFYLNNWMHDWWYDSGFTEATGNAQLDNYGRGGVAGDPIRVLAQAGANVGQRDNATMSTPADGGIPRMRIFLFTTNTVTALTTPLGLPHAEGFSAPPHTFTLTGTVAAGDDGVAPGNDGCQPLGGSVAGKIALLTFSGVCGSAATVNNAKAAGAIGVILADGALDDPRAFAGSAAANLPGLAIGKTDGEALLAALANGPVTVTLNSAPFGVERDGDLDSGVSGHEWAHYLHHRLAVCNTGKQCGGMSEGWGDFNGVLLQMREGDNRDGTYAQGSYADASGTPNAAYFSVRRFPYSRDRTKNDLSFRHIGDENPLPTQTPGRLNGGPNSEVHNAGEVWTSMLWEAFNVLVDEHGTPIGRRRMSDYVVAGLLMTPPEATFTEARDAILAAASALDTDDMLLMAAAFAGRGAGSCAVSPSNASPTNAGVVESGTIAGKLAAGNLKLGDDVVSHDNDGVLDPGESGLLHVTVVNEGPSAAENMVVTATTMNAGVVIGKPVHIALVLPFASADLTIPVALAASVPPNSDLTIKIHVAAQQTCDKNGIDVVLTTKAGTGVATAAPSAALQDSRVIATFQAPETSLSAVDTEVCIASDTP